MTSVARSDPKAEASKSPDEPGVIAASVYAGGRRISDIPIDAAGQWSKQEGHVVWIGLFEPSEELLRRVQVQLDLHPLAIEDAGKPHQQPKLEQYGKALFIVARTAQMAGEEISFGETHIFLGRGYLISVRHGASTYMQLFVNGAKHVRPSLLMAKTTSFMRSSTSSLTTICRSSKRSRRRLMISKMAC